MTLSEACAAAQAAIARAKALFGPDAAPDAGAGYTAARLRQAQQHTTETVTHMSGLSGALPDAHRDFGMRSAAHLGVAAGTDQNLNGYLTQAAQLTRNGHSQMEDIAEQNRATVRAAAGAKSPAAQRAITAQLHNQITQAQAVVNATRQQSTAIADGIRALSYSPNTPSSPDDHIVGDDPHRPHTQLVDNPKQAPPAPPQPGQPVDPTDPFVNDWRFGHWEDVPPPPPYVGTPPPLKNEYRPLPQGTPLTIGPTTGMYTPGQTWIGDIDPPAVQGKEGYRFRLAGTEATTTTRMVNTNGVWQQQRWVQNVYEYQRNTSLVFGGDIGLKGIDGEAGDLGGLPPIQNIDHQWHPITLPKIASLSGANPDITYYLPDGCGGTTNFHAGVIPTDPNAPPGIPIMTRPR